MDSFGDAVLAGRGRVWRTEARPDNALAKMRSQIT